MTTVLGLFVVATMMYFGAKAAIYLKSLVKKEHEITDHVLNEYDKIVKRRDEMIHGLLVDQFADLRKALILVDTHTIRDAADLADVARKCLHNYDKVRNGV